MLITTSGVKVKEVAREAASVAALETEGEEEGVRRKDEKRETTQTPVAVVKDRLGLSGCGLLGS